MNELGIHLDYSMYIEIVGRFFLVGLYIIFAVGCGLLWRFTCRISWGHDVIGRIVVVILFMALLLLWKQPQRHTLFLITILFPLSVWLYFNVLYFSKYPLPAELLKELRNSIPGSVVFMPKMALMKYLFRDSPELQRPWWFSNSFRNIGIAAGGVFLLLFGFSESIEGYTWGLKMVAKVRQETTAKTDSTVKTAVKAAVDSTKKTFYAVADTLKAGQEELSQKVDSTRRESQQRTNEVKRGLKRTNARFSRPTPFIFNQPQPVGFPQPNFPLPSYERINKPVLNSIILINSVNAEGAGLKPDSTDTQIIAKHFMK